MKELLEYLKSQKYQDDAQFIAEEFPWDECIAEQKKNDVDCPECLCAAIKNRTVKHLITTGEAKDIETALQLLIEKQKTDKAFSYLTSKLSAFVNIKSDKPEKTGHIYIYGAIGSTLGQKGVELIDVITQVQKQASASELNVHIQSPGGMVEVGFAIHDYLVGLKKDITTIIEGQCASIATIIALAGDKRRILPGSEFFIHNPWAEVIGDTDELLKYAEELKKVEDTLVDFYSKKTGISKQGVDGLMKQKTSLTPEKALELGFVTEIVSALKAVASVTKNTNTNINQKFSEMKKQILEAVNALLTKIGVKGKGKVEYTTTEGKKLIVDEAGDVWTVGDMVTDEAGNPTPNATYTFPDGSSIKTDADSKISEIVPGGTAQTETEATKQIQEAAKELGIEVVIGKKVDLVGAIKQLKKDQTAFETEVNNKIETLAKSITSDYVVPDKEQNFRRSNLTNNMKNVADAVDRMKKAREEKK